MISDLNKHRFEYIWHLYSNNISDTDLPFHKHVKCDPSVWQFPEHLVEYHRLIFGLGYTSLKDKKVLDIGCGISWYLGSMENIVKKYIGVDDLIGYLEDKGFTTIEKQLYDYADKKDQGKGQDFEGDRYILHFNRQAKQTTVT